MFIKDGFDCEMPEVRAYYILEYLFEIGISIGEHALTFGEIESWQNMTGVELQPWEAKTIKKLSEAYLSASREATDKDAESPWADAPAYMSKSYLMARRMQEQMRGAAKL